MFKIKLQQQEIKPGIYYYFMSKIDWTTLFIRCIGDQFSGKFSMLTFAFPFLLSNLVVLDYKTLVLLLAKKTNVSLVLGGRGVSVEFCFICNAIRVKYSNDIEISTRQLQLVLLKLRYIKVLHQLINFFYSDFR